MSEVELLQETNLLLKIIAGLMGMFLIGLAYDIYLLEKQNLELAK